VTSTVLACGIAIGEARRGSHRAPGFNEEELRLIVHDNVTTLLDEGA